MTRRPVAGQRRFDRVGRDRDFGYWHETDQLGRSSDVRSRVDRKWLAEDQNGAFDPQPTMTQKFQDGQ